MPGILILTALDEELNPFDGNAFKEVAFATLGLGQINAGIHTMRLLALHKPDHCFLMGTCGSLKPEFRQGDAVGGSLFINGDFDLAQLVPGFKKETIGTDGGTGYPNVSFYSCSTFMNEEQKRKIDADVVDMESFAFAKACITMAVPFKVCKIVSDNVSGDARKEFWDFVNTSYNPNPILETLIKSIHK